ncbi:hypothetical protein KKC08_02860 [Patescibacteria group bacterium]|nr:hypothetical protein [Patescibacteria group bacterium]MBU4265294.1 hypothetical protein [Patescibacteria group bacterium]MBU4389979.1 hypothetical protein [Patescibacteria group bacterium]MBU4397078.1 hypothetical protein [Patescibacteria group bacterium]MBU4430906.1 hypothetical protein [Patescibacteria group bacterium]
MNNEISKLLTEAKKSVSIAETELLDDLKIILRKFEGNDDIHDYSFIVASAAKAYEGHLKYFFLKINLIDKRVFSSDRFRVGKALNPSLRYKRFSIYQKMSDMDSSGEELAEILWDAWKRGRNEIFHYFPDNLKKLTKDQATERIKQILKAILASSKFLQKNKY